jgi:hypothetical protein
MERNSWEEFKACGMLWFVNRLLHVFGWAIVFEYDDNDNVTDVFPARVDFRGFDEETETAGFRKISAYMKETAPALDAEANLP